MANVIDIDAKIKEMAGRIKALREIEGLTTYEMAKKTDITEEEYIKCEQGLLDLNFAFIYRCALAFNVDVTDIIEGRSPTLKSYTLTRSGKGQKIEQAHGMTYYNLAPAFKSRIAEPLYVCSEYSEEAQSKPIELTTHVGQECDIVLKGSLKIKIGDHEEILYAGDSIYYDSSTPHGMIAVNGEDCIFYAIVLNPTNESSTKAITGVDVSSQVKNLEIDNKKRVYNKFIDVQTDENGTPTKINFKNVEKFNFAFDVVDELAKKSPDKLALLHVDRNSVERRFTFEDIKKYSNRSANYFASLGIKKGDKVLLCLGRDYEFWFAILGLHKIGAVAIPAMNQLLDKDFEYRFKSADVKAVICTAKGGASTQVDLASVKCPNLEHKILVGGTKEGWRNFNEEFERFSTHYKRTEESAGGDDSMLMFFTSGTTGYPKIAEHSFKYVLGHFHTAKYWHQVDPDGLHFTISDTGWAKALWGKLYGQWLCEGALFVCDFERFNSSDILSVFKKYGVTTFCAPPTMLRMLVKEDLSKYDLSSIKHITTAGEALNFEVYRQFKEATGLSIEEGFGQTETTLVIGNLRGAKTKAGSMGKAVPVYDIDLLDSDGNIVPNGQTGEICIKTSEQIPCGLFKGYYKDSEKTNDAWHDGYYHTGDLAWKDEDGFYWYVGRADDVIKSSGYRIGPFEIESVIMELPYVLECGVSSAPDEVRGQVVKASIVLTKGTVGTEELKKEIQEYVKKRTAPYKYPRIVVFKEQLPKTISGKIQRNKL